MADFSSIEDWSLQAIVGGSSKTNNNNNTAMTDSCHGQQRYCTLSTWDHAPHDDDDFLFAFSEIFGQTSKLMDDGLEALYKPFYPISDSISDLNDVKYEADHQEVKYEVDQSASIDIATSSYEPKYKKRKNHHKRVVMQVKAEDLSSDKWAWRKYGQKPIKGSVYPRSYYRCSSKKGCLARKQVEQSCKDPSMYIVTYTAEHCHSQPTRKNSLAGTVRNKFPTINNDNIPMNVVAKAREGSVTCCPESNEVVRTPKSSERLSMLVKEEKLGGYNIDEFAISDIMMNGHDFFAELEDLNGSILESSLASFQNVSICSK